MCDASHEQPILNPYIHVDDHRIYNPLLDSEVEPPDTIYATLRKLWAGTLSVDQLATDTRDKYELQGWLTRNPDHLSHTYLLKYVSLEAHASCNQSCYFCPVSIAPRPSHLMPMDMFTHIAQQLTGFLDSLEVVWLHNYNEPTADKRFVDQVRILKQFNLPIGINTNATGLTPSRVDDIMSLGGLRFLSVNLSTMDTARYAKERGRDHLGLVMRNLDYVKDHKIAEQMDMAVLGKGDACHDADFEQIERHFAGSHFNVKRFVTNDRASYLDHGLTPMQSHGALCGCEQTGSRPLQHLHITAHGKCVVCCQDYSEKYVVGDLSKESVTEVLSGSAMAQVRKWTYGVETAPEDYICRKCIFARTRTELVSN